MTAKTGKRQHCIGYSFLRMTLEEDIVRVFWYCVEDLEQALNYVTPRFTS